VTSKALRRSLKEIISMIQSEGQKMAEDTVMTAMRHKLPYLNPALRRIADYTLRFPQDVKSMTINDLAEKCEVSESTITRFVREIGIKSFQELKIGIAEDLTRANRKERQDDERLVYEDITGADDVEAITRKIHYRMLSTLDETFAQLDTGVVEKAVKAIRKSNLLAFFAMGASTLAVESGILRYLRIGKKCLFFKDQGIQQISAVALDASCVTIAVSNSGRTHAVVRAQEAARQLGAKTICITAFPNSPLAAASDICIVTPTTTVPFGRAEYHESMTSKIAQIAVMDILYSAVAVLDYERSISKLEETNQYTAETRRS
jgi:RpiR family transcriptional regulator, carbohydrate utilization regulator